ncbi:MAG: PhnD/SsuA/transferrin family substrate-binding protein [Melioribacteraceae bacterium]|nr:PhnD/SsuA/transferrin family substrate-binding protein [Melioribacteraceae bacterium]
MPVLKNKKYFTSVLLYLIIFGNLYAGNFSAKENPKEINFLFLDNLFPDSKSRDFQASFELWLSDLFKSSDLNYKPRIRLISTSDLYNRNYDESNTYMMVFLSIDYLRMKNKVQLEPLFIASEADMDIYCLVTNKKVGSSAELKNTRLSSTHDGFGVIGEYWLDYYIKNKTGESINDYFSEIIREDSESKIIHSSFFGKTDACIVRKKVFDTACELNPQISSRLHILAESEPLLHSIMCLTNKFTSKERDIFIDGVKKMNETESGKQILRIFKQKSVLRFDKNMMNSIQKIYNKTEN